MTSLLLIGLPVLAEQGRTNMGFEKLTKMIIVKVLSLFFWNHFVKIVGCLINLYKFRGRKFWSGCKNSSKNDKKIVKWRSGEGYMIYIRVCNSACLALFDLEGLGACLLNLNRRTFRCSEKKQRTNHYWLYVLVFKHVCGKKCCLPMCLLCVQNLNPIQINENTHICS